MIKSFNGLRFYFSIFIFLNHCVFLRYTSTGASIFEKFFHNGGFAVDFFFILSGFCMYLGYSKKFQSIELSRVKSYIFKRIKKIYPLYLLTMLYVFVYSLFTEAGFQWSSVVDLIISASMLQTLTIVKSQILKGAGWFISCIFVLYILTPFILFFINKIQSYQKATLLWIVIYIVLALMIIGIYCLQNIRFVSEHFSLLFLYVSPYVRIFYYIGGMLLAYTSSNLFTNLTKQNGTLLEFFSIAVMSIAYFLGIKIGTENQITNLIYVPVISFAIIIFSKDKGIVSRFMANNINSYLGSISMEIYLLHYIVINYGGSALLIRLFGSNTVLLFVYCITLFLLTIAASAIYQKISIKIFDRRKLK